ncbi:hypothetical protein L1987_37563 [Smallanthus sonchifolius]|uniref:Uncharacterized protein n=1 Tax=Smallanthus sonchifolius TaxID=185202 RepID=A0ACB9HJ98_9ASTR|nr:hypothetical protein L1987_37563 [Smallanthus sonchifolius]
MKKTDSTPFFVNLIIKVPIAGRILCPLQLPLKVHLSTAKPPPSPSQNNPTFLCFLGVRTPVSQIDQ